MTVFLPV